VEPAAGECGENVRAGIERRPLATGDNDDRAALGIGTRTDDRRIDVVDSALGQPS
jgi:hypothetical protein